MDRLSSCYFCGAALDATLDEHPVVPASLHPGTDTQKTVVLCGTCKRKLDAVMDQVVAAVEARADETLDADDGGTETDEADIEATLGDDADVLQPVGDDGDADDTHDDAAAAAEASGMQFGDDRADDGDDDPAAEGADDSAEGDDAGDDGENERKYTESRRAGYTGEDEADDGDDQDAGASDDVTMTRLENTKVMRLLQNREFPVERDGFVTVASSAYEVAPGDCDKVLDLAIEHGLLREDDGQLLAGPEWG